MANLGIKVIRMKTVLPTKKGLLYNCQLCCTNKLLFLVEGPDHYSGRSSVHNTEAKLYKFTSGPVVFMQCVANTVLTFVHVLHYPLFKDIMTTIPS